MRGLGVILKNPLADGLCGEKGMNPNPNQKSTGKTQLQKLCTIEGGYQGTTHVKYVYVFFSVRKNKFIKPMRRIGDRVVGKFIYELYPGQYILIGYDSRSKEEPPRVLIAQLVTIDNECKEHYSEALIIRFENFEWVEKQDLPQMLKDIVNWVPGYHSPPNIDFNKVYSEVDVQRLLSMIAQKLRITEGEEHE